MVQKRDNIDLDIILLLVKGEAHLREIARMLGESHSTVLRRVNKLVKENVLGYKREGKNKIFFIKNNLQAKNYVFSAERYKLIKLLKKYPELISRFANLLCGLCIWDSQLEENIRCSYCPMWKPKLETKDGEVLPGCFQGNDGIKAILNSAKPSKLIRSFIKRIEREREKCV